MKFDWLKRLFINRNQSDTHERNIYSNALPINDVLDDEPEWIRIVPVGVFPIHHNGPHEITAEHIEEMAENFNNSNTDLLFDYEHRSLWGDSIAAGWSAEVEAREDGLYAKYPAFTAKAQEHIEDREYRYLSPTYRLDALDKSGRDIGAVVLHVAITNTPYLDNEIDHIGNSRLIPGQQESEPETDTRTDMKLNKENLKKLGLSEDATEEEINEAIANSQFAESSGKEAGASGEGSEAGAAEPGKGGDDEQPKANSKSDEDLAAKVNSLEKKLSERESAEKNEKAEALVNSALSEGKILPRDKNAYLTFAKNDFDAAKSAIDELKANSAMPGKVSVSGGGTGTGGGDDQKEDAFANAVNFLKPQIAASKKSA